MPRVCFRLQLRRDLVDAYVDRHRSVDHEVLRAIRDAGRRDYSIFVGDDGLLIGVYDVDDDAAATAALAADPRTAAWEVDSAAFFTDLDGRPDQTASRLTEVFRLENQLPAVEGAPRTA